MKKYVFIAIIFSLVILNTRLAQASPRWYACSYDFVVKKMTTKLTDTKYLVVEGELTKEYAQDGQFCEYELNRDYELIIEDKKVFNKDMLEEGKTWRLISEVWTDYGVSTRWYIYVSGQDLRLRHLENFRDPKQKIRSFRILD